MKEKLKTINKIRKEIKEIEKEIDRELKIFEKTKYTTIHNREHRQSKEKLGILRKKSRRKQKRNKRNLQNDYRQTNGKYGSRQSNKK